MEEDQCSCKPNWSHFGFVGASSKLFQRIQWTPIVWVHFGYRFFMFAYVVFWMIYGYVVDRYSLFWQELSNWSEAVLVLYHTYSFCLSIYVAVVRNSFSNEEKENLPWFYKINWILFNVSTVAAFQISTLYWSLLAPGRNRAKNLNPTSFHIHATNSILTVINLFMIAHPVRLLHFFYTVLYGVVYTIFLLILHATGVNSAVYAVLDWAESPGTAAGYTVLSIVVLPATFQGIAFGLYRLRLFIYQNTVMKDEQPTNEASVDKMKMGEINKAFEAPPPYEEVVVE